jgi:hypothetical protein
LGDENLMDDTKDGAPDKAPEKVIPSKKVSSKKSSAGSKTSKKTASKKQGFQIPEQIDIIWTVALIVAAFALGFFMGGSINAPKVEDQTLSPMMQTTPGDVSSSESQGGGSMNAPTLDESQLNGEMPSGHPNIDDSGDTGDEMGSGEKSDVPSAGSSDSNSVDVKEDPGTKKE